MDITDPPPPKRGRGSTSKWKEITNTQSQIGRASCRERV